MVQETDGYEHLEKSELWIEKNSRSLITFGTLHMKGDQQNRAIVLHCEGWNHNTSSSDHSVAAITITHNCMSKINWTVSNMPVCTPSLPLDSYQKMHYTNWMHSWSPLQESWRACTSMVRRCSLKRKWTVLHLMTLWNFQFHYRFPAQEKNGKTKPKTQGASWWDETEGRRITPQD